MKLIAALYIILAIVSQPPGDLLPFALYGILLLLLVLLSRIPFLFVIRRVLLILPFVVFAAVFYPISVKLSDSSVDLTIHHPAVLKGVSILLKAVLSVMVLTILVSTERFHHLLGAMRRLKMPSVLCVTSALMYRYIFILADESMKTSLARQSRTPGKIKQNKLKVLGNQVAVIFLRSWERSRMIYDAMVSRGFSGDFPNGERKEIKTVQLITLFSLGFIVAFVRFMRPIQVFLDNLLF